MKKNNILDKTTFILFMLILPANFGFVFRSVFLYPIEGLTIRQSSVIFWIIYLAAWITGGIIAYKKRQNAQAIALVIAIPIEIYFIICTIRYLTAPVVAALVAVAVLCAAYLAVIVSVNKTEKKLTKAKLFRCIKFAVPGLCNIFAVVFLCVLIPVCSNTLNGYGFITTDDTSIDISDDTWTISNNIETVALLDPETWQTLSIKEKLEVLEVVKNIEIKYLGINDASLYLATEPLEKNVGGNFNEHENKITIDIDYLKTASSEEVLDVILHECKHMHDKRCADAYEYIGDEYKSLLLFREIGEYKKEFSSYISGSESFFDYYTQLIEISAREYSEENIEIYFSYIREYLNKENNTNTEE